MPTDATTFRPLASSNLPHSTLVGFDTETTGIDTARDRIVTAALVVRVPGISTQVFNWLIDPGVEIPEAASAVHGITTAHVRTHGVAPAEALAQVAAVLTAHLQAGATLVAFNARFDLDLLHAELERHGLATLPERLGRAVGPVLDPLVLDRWLDRYRRGKRRLGDLANHYGVAPGELHSADADVLATLDVLAAMARRYPGELGTRSALELHAIQAQAHREWAIGFADWLARQGVNRPGPDPSWLPVPDLSPGLPGGGVVG